MPDVYDLLGKSKQASNLLRGTDLPRNMRELKAKISAVRQAPEGFRSPLIIDFDGEVMPGKTAMPVNITNAKALAELLGKDYDKWAGATITLAKVATNNPQTGQNTWGLRVVDAQRARGRKPKASKKAKPEAEDEVPF